MQLCSGTREVSRGEKSPLLGGWGDKKLKRGEKGGNGYFYNFS